MDSKTNIRVAVRVRPFNHRELEQNQKNIIKVLDSSNLVFDPEEDEDEFFFHGIKQVHRDITKRVKKKLTIEFDDIFDTNANNVDVFETCTKPLIASVMDGYNCSVFVYGATGAGKTHTMLGNELNPGITFLTMRFLFENMDSLSSERKFDIGISYLEVYNEQVMNLLTKSGPLKLREDANGVVVGGLVLKKISNAEELLDLLALGNRNRTQHPTDANAESSRSHAIFQVHIRMTDRVTSLKKTVKLSMIDLAGSERAASTKGLGLRFKEGANINKSLLALGNCINKLADGMKHIPYRDSNLTRILKDSLGGNCQTLMIANISPSSLTYEDTYNTLKYASRTKKIRTTLKQNVVQSNVPKDYLVKKVNEQTTELEKMKTKIKQLESKLAEMEKTKPAVKSVDESSLHPWYKKIDEIFSSLIKAQEYYFLYDSKEKTLIFKNKIKEVSENSKKVICINGFTSDESEIRFEASQDKFDKLINKFKEDKIKWLKIFNESLQKLECLKQQINTEGLEKLLDKYLENKKSEMVSLKLNIKLQHLSKINSIHQNENDFYQKTLHFSCSLLQESYTKLCDQNLMDSILKQKIEQLHKTLQIGSRNVKFTDEKEIINEANNMNMQELNICQITNLCDMYSEDKPNLKRSNDSSLDCENETKMFKSEQPTNDSDKPKHKLVKTLSKSTKTINVTAQSHTNSHNKLKTKNSSTMSSTVTLTDSDYCNSTFSVPARDISPTSNDINSILTETNSKNPELLRRALKQASTKTNLVAQMSLQINKENKKFSPKRIGKCAKSLIRNPIKTGISQQRPKSAVPLDSDKSKNLKHKK